MILLTVTEFRNNMSKYIELAFRERVALKSKSGILELNPSKKITLNPANPSPSGDPWFDDPRNLAELNRRIDDLHSGKEKAIPRDEVKKKLTK